MGEKNDATQKPYSGAEESFLLLKLYSDVGTGRFWQGFMQQLADRANLKAGVVSITDPSRGEVRGAWTWNMDIETMRQYVDGDFVSGDDFLTYLLQAESGRFYGAGQDLIKIIDYEAQSAIYREWLTPLGVHDVAMALLSGSEGWITFVALYRSQAQGVFTSAELRWLDRLIPHIGRAVNLHGELVQRHGKPRDVDGWLSLIKVPTLLFDENFTCTDQNQAARQFFAAQEHIRLESGRIAVDERSLTNQLALRITAAIKAALGQTSTDPGILQVSEGIPVPTTFVFMPVENQPDSPVTTAGALVFIYQRDFTQDLDLAPLQDSFGLTAAEVEVCRGLAQGLAPEQIAHAGEKSRETVRSQLKQAFSKVGVRNQAELVLTCLTHPSVISPS